MVQNNEASRVESGNNSNDGRRNEENDDLNKWLPITASRKAKWWFSAFHNVTAIVGAGVLGLPCAVSQLGWIPGIGMIIISWSVTLYSFWQLVNLHEHVPGKRFDRYPELGKHIFGQKRGYWMVMPQQIIVQVACDIVYMVTGGKSLRESVKMMFHWGRKINQTYYIMFFGVLQLILSQAPNFNSLKVVSFTAAVMSLSYSTIASVASIIKGIEHPKSVSYGLRSHTTAGIIFDIFNSLGTIAFAFAGHSVALEIQATIPSTPERPSKSPMWRGVVVAYAIVAFCYLSVAASGFWAFGNLVADDVLVTLEHPNWLISLANFMVFLHVLGSYQVFAMPVFDTIESFLVKKRHFTPGRPLRLIARSIYVVLTMFIGICIPFFGGLLGFFGGLAFSSTSFFLPCMMWLVSQKPKKWSIHWIASWISIIIGVSITILAPIGGARTIIISAKKYKLFSHSEE
ncbi:PREDICTED: lysine histidine transporter-like 5 [Nicotiana attenuata]|uniref:Lysine histidine transporter-like 5 n=1 Tax=Nicotiana attenuata TaxID=49451 RepID=A0A1J6ILV0_NICAT|nr:PREDICTED: lysine histidine transporter-like 5 [Nicotiana attenuata]OIS96136.1 lysine histidine transporter-like 5 [Nicotiana attenuata]